MSYARAINEIAGLLTQGGTPANHANDIAARITVALQDYYDSRQASSNKADLNASSARSSAFRRAFLPPESSPSDGAAGDDGQGAYAWAAGKDGKDGKGEDGSSGLDGFNGLDGVDGGGGGGYRFDIRNVPCDELKKKLKDCGISTGRDGKDATNKCPPGGPFPNLEICSILDQQAKELGKQRRKIRELEERIKSIEKTLADTVDCPEA